MNRNFGNNGRLSPLPVVTAASVVVAVVVTLLVLSPAVPAVAAPAHQQSRHQHAHHHGRGDPVKSGGKEKAPASAPRVHHHHDQRVRPHKQHHRDRGHSQPVSVEQNKAVHVKPPVSSPVSSVPKPTPAIPIVATPDNKKAQTPAPSAAATIGAQTVPLKQLRVDASATAILTSVQRAVTDALRATAAAVGFGGTDRPFSWPRLPRPAFLKFKSVNLGRGTGAFSSAWARASQRLHAAWAPLSSERGGATVLVTVLLGLVALLSLPRVRHALKVRVLLPLIMYSRRGPWQDDPRLYVVETRMRMVERTERAIQRQRQNTAAGLLMNSPDLRSSAAGTPVSPSPRAPSPAASRLPGGSMSPAERAGINPGQQLGRRSVSSERASMRSSQEWLLVDDEGNSAAAAKSAGNAGATDASQAVGAASASDFSPKENVASAADVHTVARPDAAGADDDSDSDSNEPCPSLVSLDWTPYEGGAAGVSGTTARAGVPSLHSSRFTGHPPTAAKKKKDQ